MNLDDLTALKEQERRVELRSALVSPEYGYTLMEGNHELLYKYDTGSGVLKVIDLEGFIDESQLQDNGIMRKDIGTQCFAFRLNDAAEQLEIKSVEYDRMIDVLQSMNDYSLRHSEMFTLKDFKVTKYVAPILVALCAGVGMYSPVNFVFAFFGSLIVGAATATYDASVYRKTNRAIEQDNKEYAGNLATISILKIDSMQSVGNLKYDAKLVSEFIQKAY
jgi:hypothetical protein